MTISFNLKAEEREGLGSSHSRRYRKQGKIPAIIDGRGGENTRINIDSNEFEKEYFKGNIFTTIINLKLGDKDLQVVPNKISFHPVTDRPTHIDFREVKKGEQAKVHVKIRFFNKEKSPGIKRGGFLNVALRKVTIMCDPELIPDEIAIDVAGMVVGDKVKTIDLKLPKGASLCKNNRHTVASILGRGVKEEKSNQSEGGDEEGDEGDVKSEESSNSDKE